MRDAALEGLERFAGDPAVEHRLAGPLCATSLFARWRRCRLLLVALEEECRRFCMGIGWRGPLQGKVMDGLELRACLFELGGALRIYEPREIVFESTIGIIRDLAAIRFLHREHGVMVEGSGAVGVAALLSGAIKPREFPVAVTVSGGNIEQARWLALTTDA
jgi:hypothetical protein